VAGAYERPVPSIAKIGALRWIAASATLKACVRSSVARPVLRVREIKHGEPGIIAVFEKRPNDYLTTTARMVVRVTGQ
jgi:hypothetical protein